MLYFRSFNRFILISLAMLGLSVSSVNAAFMVFTDRVAWQAAAGGGTGDLFEDFTSFDDGNLSSDADVLYGAGILYPAVSAGFLTFSVITSPSNIFAVDGSWRIDEPSDRFPGGIPNVDGTPFATTLGTELFGDTLMEFGNVSALGFDYSEGSYGNADGTLTTSLGDSVTLLNQATVEIFFLGLLYTEGEQFNSLAWGSVFDATAQSNNFQYGIGIDNVEAYSTFAPNPVPVPAAVWLFGTALIGFIGMSRRRKVA